jgi:hypothetical protein
MRAFGGEAARTARAAIAAAHGQATFAALSSGASDGSDTIVSASPMRALGDATAAPSVTPDACVGALRHA